MKSIPSADFRKSYPREEDVVEVTAYDTPLGYWLPVGASQEQVREVTALFMLSDEHLVPSPVEEEPPRMTIRPVKGPGKALVATEKRIIDPVEIRAKVKAEEAARFGKPGLGRSRFPRPG